MAIPYCTGTQMSIGGVQEQGVSVRHDSEHVDADNTIITEDKNKIFQARNWIVRGLT